jgi:hypothetical protein
MKLYILLGSLVAFQRLFDESAYLRQVLEETPSNVYLVKDGADVREVKRLLDSRNIKYKLKEG